VLVRRPLPSLRRAVAVGALLALTAACGSSSDGSATSDRLSPVAAVQAAAEATEQEESFRFRLDSLSTTGGQTFEVTADGVFDLAARNGTITVSLPNGLGSLEQIFVGERVFMAVPGSPGYYSFNLDEIAGTPFEAMKPGGSLDLLREVAGDVEEVGDETVRGERTTRYRASVDPRKALEQAGATAGMFEQLGIDPASLEDVPLEVWLDSEQRVRRMTFELTVPASEATGGQEISTTVTLEMYEFGVDVQVEEPPADQVQDGSALLGGLGGQPGADG
jgi:hypothetical protein